MYELQKKKINYLSNKLLLSELNKSKLNYCEFIDNKYKHHDISVSCLEDITSEVIEKAKQNHIEYLTNKEIIRLINTGLTTKAATEKSKETLKTLEISKDDLCFRVFTKEHIPTEILENRKLILEILYFYPFKHYAFKDGVLTEVGKSHWSGGVFNGKFDQNKGKISNQLINSLILLVDRYAQRGNFRNYTYLEDMKGQALLQLSKVALQFDETKSENPFAWFTTIIYNSFIKVLKEEKKVRQIRDSLVSSSGLSASYSFQMDNEEE